MLQLLRPRLSNNWLIAPHKVLFLVIYSMELMKCGNEACHSCFRYLCIQRWKRLYILIIYQCNFYFLSLRNPFLAKYIGSCILMENHYIWILLAGYQERPTIGNNMCGLQVQTILIAKLSLELSLPRYYFASICLHFDDMRSMALLNGSIIKWSLDALASQEGRQGFDHGVYET